MGEVYRAKDTRLERTVAIKVLPAHLSSDAESKQRMVREAKAISALQHANICTLHDVGSQDGTDFLVMEYLEGQTLDARLEKGALPLDQVLKIGIEIADALESAHREGITHRDLKPGNIMVTKAGAKLMDFGLAKPMTPLASEAVGAFTPSTPTMNIAQLSGAVSPLTQKGSVVGTFQYMAPEVLQGAEADVRSDLFSFGCVLYEMLTGRRAFEGKSQLSVFTAILEKEPEPITASRPPAPPMIDMIVRGCLAKDPADRVQSAHDVAMQLRWTASLSKTAAEAQSITAKAPNRMLWLALIVAALVLGIVASVFLRPPAQPTASIRAVINPPLDTRFRLTSDLAGPPILSPDGTYLAFTAIGADGKTNLWVRSMNSGDARMLSDTNDAIFPFWSPNSDSLGFFANGKMRTIELNSTAAQTLCDAQLGRGGAWSRSGVIVFSASPTSPLSRISANGGSPAPLIGLDTLHSSLRWPMFLPDGRHFLYFAMNHDPSKASNNAVYYASLDGRENRMLIRAQSNALYAAGFLLFSRGDQLMAQPFDPDKGRLRGDPQTISSGVLNDVSTWRMTTSASDNGLLAFGNGSSGSVEMVWMDRAGNTINLAANNLQNLQYASLAPQGNRVALTIDSGVNDVWVLDLARGVRTRLTFGPVGNTFPVWSPDGRWIAYSSLRPSGSGIYRRAADGSGGEEILVPAPEGTLIAPSDWSHDGKTLFYSPNSYTQKEDGIWAASLNGDGKPRQVLLHGSNAVLSPNGHWLAYSSTESGRREVYVIAYGGAEGKWQVSPSGGQVPQWSADGKELFYFDANQSLVTVSIRDSGSALQFGAPQTLISQWTILTVPFYSVSADGKRILMERVSQQVNQPITIITNFTAGLKK
jgi:eukaryotic-like serine/threonine-protein kinase